MRDLVEPMDQDGGQNVLGRTPAACFIDRRPRHLSLGTATTAGGAKRTYATRAQKFVVAKILKDCAGVSQGALGVSAPPK